MSWHLAPSETFSVKTAYQRLFRGPVRGCVSPVWKVSLLLKIKIFMWQLLRDRLPSEVEVRKRHRLGNGLCPMCGILETGTHNLFTCPAPGFYRTLSTSRLGLRPQRVPRDPGELYRGRLVFAAMAWTFWTIRNKMLIEWMFLRRASDSMFNSWLFLQPWYPLSKQRDMDWLDKMLDRLMVTARRLTSSSSS